MLENIPHWLGSALAGVRAGHDKLTLAKLDLTDVASFELSSTAFASGGRLPQRFTADGEGVSPPLVWRGLPDGADCLALIVEDADAPTPRPLVHAIVVAIDPALGGLPEGAIVADGDGTGAKDVGVNSYFVQGWLPPDPPTGHGEHDYVFQLLALRSGEGVDGDRKDTASPGRGDFVDMVKDRVIAAGVLVATYSREQDAPVGVIGATTRSSFA